MDQDLSVLIIQLKSLHIRETRILEQLERMRVQETRVIQQIEGAREHRCQLQGIIQEAHRLPPPVAMQVPAVVQEEIIQADPFTIGQQVCIHNKVRRRHGQPAIMEADQRATVTNYDQLLDKVSIVTDNGFHSWRLSTNLRPLD